MHAFNPSVAYHSVESLIWHGDGDDATKGEVKSIPALSPRQLNQESVAHHDGENQPCRGDGDDATRQGVKSIPALSPRQLSN